MKKVMATGVALVLLISCFVLMAFPASAAGGEKLIQSGGYDLDLAPVFIVIGAGFLLIVGILVVGIIIKKRNEDDEYDDDDEEDDDDDDEPVIETENLEE